MTQRPVVERDPQSSFLNTIKINSSDCFAILESDVEVTGVLFPICIVLLFPFFLKY